MEKKFINKLPKEERLRIGKIVKDMANGYNELCTTLFVYDNKKDANEHSASGEKFQGSSELMDSFMAWIKGDDFESIGDDIFQTGSALVEEIFRSIGITETDNEMSEFT